MNIEPLFLRMPYGFSSRFRVMLFKMLGMAMGKQNRFEAGRTRRVNQIQMGKLNHFSEGWWLWPEDTPYEGMRIVIGDNNYFNKNLMLDACGLISIGDNNMIGPDVYITDSNHTFGAGLNPHEQTMNKGRVTIGNGCWIGAKAIILKDVELGDFCVVAAGAVVTKSFPGGSVVAGIPARLIKSY
jgi:acetyltransferase-like isoleucine patch superfamily enzyme